MSVFLRSLGCFFFAGVDVCVGLKLQSGVDSRVLRGFLVAKELGFDHSHSSVNDMSVLSPKYSRL